uniref:GTP-binding protein Di-Ras2 n=1 Tax=Plectus sambesii TaxID=2011161 RepID=A0A914XCI4_9BILA
MAVAQLISAGNRRFASIRRRHQPQMAPHPAGQDWVRWRRVVGHTESRVSQSSGQQGRVKAEKSAHSGETMATGRAARSNSKGTVMLHFTSTAGSRMAEQTNDYRVAVFGAGGVGKSSIVLRFVKGTFNDNYVPTIEDTYRQVIGCNQKSVCTLQITDTTGSHQFPAMQRLSIGKGHAFVLIYSVTSKQSLEELGPIIMMLKEVKGDSIGEVPIMLVGNKKDEAKREVSTELGQKLADRWGTGFIETSAKNNENVTELFEKLLALEKKRQLTLTLDDAAGKTGSKKKCVVM